MVRLVVVHAGDGAVRREAVLLHHGLHDGDVRRDVPGHVLEHAVEELLKSVVHRVHGVLDLAERAGDVLDVRVLLHEIHVGIQELGGRRQVVVHEAAQVLRVLGGAPRLREDPVHDVLEAVELLGHRLRVGDQVVDVAHVLDVLAAVIEDRFHFLCQDGILLAELLLLLRELLLLALRFLALFARELGEPVLLPGVVGEKERRLLFVVGRAGKVALLDHLIEGLSEFLLGDIQLLCEILDGDVLLVPDELAVFVIFIDELVVVVGGQNHADAACGEGRGEADQDGRACEGCADYTACDCRREADAVHDCGTAAEHRADDAARHLAGAAAAADLLLIEGDDLRLLGVPSGVRIAPVLIACASVIDDGIGSVRGVLLLVLRAVGGGACRRAVARGVPLCRFSRALAHVLRAAPVAVAARAGIGVRPAALVSVRRNRARYGFVHPLFHLIAQARVVISLDRVADFLENVAADLKNIVHIHGSRHSPETDPPGGFCSPFSFGSGIVRIRRSPPIRRPACGLPTFETHYSIPRPCPCAAANKKWLWNAEKLRLPNREELSIITKCLEAACWNSAVGSATDS